MAQGWTIDQSFGLLAGLEAGELYLDYQPIFDLDTLECVGVEALIRWRHPQRGTVYPDQFLPHAQQRGLADRLTKVVICEALAQHRAWREAGHIVPVSINIGPDGFIGRASFDVIERALDEYGVEPHQLTVEVTEGEADDVNSAIGARLIELSRLGVRVSLDDFGTGHASLARLQRWHFDEVKIDRTFVERVTHDPTDREIVAFSAGLAGALGMEVVAEGVPDDDAIRLLRQLGVDRAQGFYLARPGPPEALDTGRLQRRHAALNVTVSGATNLAADFATAAHSHPAGPQSERQSGRLDPNHV